MTPKQASLLLFAAALLGLSGCAIHGAMEELGEHYAAAQGHAKREAYADADAEVRQAEVILASDAVAKAEDAPRYLELHAQLTSDFAHLREQLQAKDPAQTRAGFEAASATCAACHASF